MKIPKEQTLYIRSMGRALKVTAIFTDDKTANAYMEKHPDEGLVSEFNGMLFLANVYDSGADIAAKHKRI